MKNLNNTAFSLLEILLSSVIFVISIGGIFATLNAVRTPVSSKEYGLSSAVFGKQVLETLRKQVSQQASTNFYLVCSGSCTTFDLELGVHSITPLPSGLSWPSAHLNTANSNTLTYTVSCANTGSISACGAYTARRVDLNIQW